MPAPRRPDAAGGPVESLGVLGEVLTAIVTPFRADGSVDLDAFRELAAYLVDHGSDGLVVAGTTARVADALRRGEARAVRRRRRAVGDRATVVAGTGTYDTRHSAHLTARAHELGVDGFLAVTPYYNKPPQRAIVRHFAGDRRRHRQAGRRLQHPEPRRRQHRVGDDRAARGDRERRRGEAGARRPRPGAVHRGRDAARPLRGRRRTRSSRSSQLGGVGGVCVHTHVWGPQTKEMVRRFKDGRRRRCARG